MAAIIRIPSAPVAASSCIRLSNALGVWAGSWARASATIVSAVRWRASQSPAANGTRASRRIMGIFFIVFQVCRVRVRFHGVRIGWSISRWRIVSDEELLVGIEMQRAVQAQGACPEIHEAWAAVWPF